MRTARDSGAVVSYDLNYRDSLWSERGGREAANELNRELMKHADVVFGVEKFSAGLAEYTESSFRKAVEDMLKATPNVKIVVTVLRDVHSASRHSLSSACYSESNITKAGAYTDIDVLDRVGSGDAFAAGTIFGLLTGRSLQQTMELGSAAAALALSCPGDGLSVTLDEVERLAGASRHDAIR
jgi:2-dehydro-3-deoxygluconokinase